MKTETDHVGSFLANVALVLFVLRWSAARTWTFRKIKNVYTWPKRMWRAMRYARKAEHRLRRMRAKKLAIYRPMVYRERERYIGKRRAPRGYKPPTPEELEPFLPVEHTINPWQDKNGSTNVATGSNAAGAGDRTAEPVFPRKSGSGSYRRYLPTLPRRRVQWATEGLQARIESVFDLVQTGLPEERYRGLHARPGLFRLSVSAR